MRAVHCVLTLFVSIAFTQVLAGPVVQLCNEYHGYAGESSGTFTLNAPIATAPDGQEFVLYARALNSESSVQMNISGQLAQTPPDQPVQTQSLPPLPLEISVLRRTKEISPFTFVSFLTNSDLCRLQLSDSTLVFPLPLVGGQPATVYVYAPPVFPYTYFNIELSTPTAVSAVYTFDPKTPLGDGIPILSNGVTAGQVPTTVAGVFIALKSNTNQAVDAVRMSILWTVPPAGWTPPPLPGQQASGNWRNRAENVAREGGSALGNFIVFLLIGGLLYLGLRSAYNYHQHGIRTFPEFVPHHQQFSAVFGAVERGVDGLRNRNVVGGTAGPSMSGPSSVFGSRRGYDPVGGEQP